MIYGMYLSATGVITASHQQDVLANNLANAETSGFKRALALTRQREVESHALRNAGMRHDLLDRIGGGQLLSPTAIDFSQGRMEQSSNPLDTAISGDGFIGVRDASGELRLTRAGEMMLNRQGDLITTQGHKVVDTNKLPIRLENVNPRDLSIGTNGEIRRGPETLATIGLFDTADKSSLRPIGQNLLAVVGDAQLAPAQGKLLSGVTEGSNVDPTTELTRLMETQRLLEANANMIKFQDASLAKLVNEVGKIG